MLVHVDRTGQRRRYRLRRPRRTARRASGRAARRAATAPPAGVPPIAEVRPRRARRRRATPSASNVRVSVEQLDKLMNLVGELVLARNEINQFSAGQRHSELLGTSQRLNAITTLLQEGVMKTRLQPIDTAWSKLPRVVRTAPSSAASGSVSRWKARTPSSTRTLIEAIQDPLTTRSATASITDWKGRRSGSRGKSVEGCISLRACTKAAR